MNKFKNISGAFFITVLVAVLYFCFVLFKPFFGAIVLAGGLVVSSYPIFEWFLKKTNQRRSVSAFFTTFVMFLIGILPLLFFFVYVSSAFIDAYGQFSQYIAGGGLDSLNQQLQALPVASEFGAELDTYLLEIAGKLNTYLLSGLAALFKGTTSFLTQLFIMILTMFFLYRDGEGMMKKVMKLTPLDDKYDAALFRDFRAVSYSAIVSSIVTGAVQGVLGSIAFYFVGVPALLLGTAMVFASFIPFVGGALIWWPVVIYLVATGQFGAALFMMLWGVFVISLSDNLLRPYLMQGDTDMHPMILFLAIFGGITVFGFLGIIYGPLIVSVALTLLKMYETEYNGILEKC
jgi:predicted PurR-regulated permease PerM